MTMGGHDLWVVSVFAFAVLVMLRSREAGWFMLAIALVLLVGWN
jgi:hypothetical protein